MRAISPSINVNTKSDQLRTILGNTFNRLDGELSSVPQVKVSSTNVQSNTGTGETTLVSGSFDSTSLVINGQSLQFIVSGITAANANAKQIRVYWSTTLIFDSGSQTFNNASWVLRGEIVRTGATSQVCIVDLVTSDATYRCGASQTLTTKNLANTQSLIVTGQGVASSDISAYYNKVIFLTN